MESILTSIKKLLGIAEEYNDFDVDLIIHINSVLAVLYQISPLFPKDFTISDSFATWQDFLGDVSGVELVKTYVYLKVRMAFDPPTTGGVLDAMKQQINELEWRLSVADNI